MQPHLVVAPQDLKNLPPYHLLTMLNCHLLEQANWGKKTLNLISPHTHITLQQGYHSTLLGSPLVKSKVEHTPQSLIA